MFSFINLSLVEFVSEQNFHMRIKIALNSLKRNENNKLNLHISNEFSNIFIRSKNINSSKLDV